MTLHAKKIISIFSKQAFQLLMMLRIQNGPIKHKKDICPQKSFPQKNFINAKNNSTNLKKCNGPILKSDH